MSELKGKIFVWNTGRLYTEEGQRMGVKWDERILYYVDIDRMCHGQVECGNISSEWELKDRALKAYDHGLGRRHIEDTQIRDEMEAYVKEHAPVIKSS